MGFVQIFFLTIVIAVFIFILVEIRKQVSHLSWDDKTKIFNYHNNLITGISSGLTVAFVVGYLFPIVKDQGLVSLSFVFMLLISLMLFMIFYCFGLIIYLSPYKYIKKRRK